jgi:protein-S-isoprenylcysteine O-methyltransferase Ste14
MSRPATVSSPVLLRWLARWRVPLGFVAAAVVFWLASPTRLSLAIGSFVAAVGEGVRLWASGHLEKSHEVTASGPYRWMRHPLYVGSMIIGGGLAIAAAHPSVALLIATYLAATITSAIRTEESYLRERFGPAYDAYAASDRHLVSRRFSVERALRNKEYRAVSGLLAGMALLALKLWVS